MKLSQLLAAGVLALSVGVFGGAANAAPITATWTGVLTGNSSSYGPSGYASLAGTSVTMTFTYDSAAVGAANTYNWYGSYQQFDGYNTPGFYSAASIALGNGASFNMAAPTPYAAMLLGDQSQYYRDLYYTYANDDAGNYLGGYFYNFVGGTTTLDPAQTFTHAMNGNDTTYLWFTFTSGGTTYYGSEYTYYYNGGGWSSVVVSGGDAVPAPGALALLGFGLIAFGGLRRRAKAA